MAWVNVLNSGCVMGLRSASLRAAECHSIQKQAEHCALVTTRSLRGNFARCEVYVAGRASGPPQFRPGVASIPRRRLVACAWHWLFPAICRRLDGRSEQCAASSPSRVCFGSRNRGLLVLLVRRRSNNSPRCTKNIPDHFVSASGVGTRYMPAGQLPGARSEELDETSVFRSFPLQRRPRSGGIRQRWRPKCLALGTRAQARAAHGMCRPERNDMCRSERNGQRRTEGSVRAAWTGLMPRKAERVHSTRRRGLRRPSRNDAFACLHCPLSSPGPGLACRLIDHGRVYRTVRRLTSLSGICDRSGNLWTIGEQSHAG